MKLLLILWLAILLIVPAIAQETFNIKVDLPKQYHTIEPGADVLANIKLINLGSTRREDISLEVSITDMQGTAKLTKKETVAVETQANFVRSFAIPPDFPLGQYYFTARVTYTDGRQSTAKQSFSIAQNPQKQIIYYAIAGLIVISILAVLAPKAKPYLEKRRVKSTVRHVVKQRLRNQK